MWALILVGIALLAVGIGGAYWLGLKAGNNKPDDFEPEAAWLKKYADLEQQALLLETQVAKERARADAKPDDTTEVALLKAQLDNSKGALFRAFDDLDSFEVELAQLKGTNQSLQEELDGLKAWIEQEFGIPGYTKARDRSEVIRKLFAAGWSKRRIMRHEWGYTSGPRLKEVNAALAGYSTSTAIVKCG